MTARAKVLLVVALLAAAGCVRLGIWQIERLRERKAYNAAVLTGFHLPPVELAALRGAPADNAYRRVVIHGRYDTDQEFALANRPRHGAPGVHLLTPLLPSASDTAVLVLRGWAYAPDAVNAELSRWQEDSARGDVGYLRLYDEQAARPRGPRPDTGVILLSLEYQEIADRLPYPLAPYLVVLLGSGGNLEDGRPVPPRLDQPVLGEGNHMSYAFQWFAFATIAVAGSLVFIRHSRRAPDGDESRFQPAPPSPL